MQTNTPFSFGAAPRGTVFGAASVDGGQGPDGSLLGPLVSASGFVDDDDGFGSFLNNLLNGTGEMSLDDLAAAGTTGAGSAFQGTSNDIFTSYNTDANISTSSANHPIYNFDINTAGAATGLGLALAQQPGLAFPATHDGLEAPELASAGTPPRAPAHGRRAASHNGLRVGPLFDPSEPIVQCPGCGKKNLSVGYLGKDPKGRHRAWRLSHMTPGRKDAARGRGIPCEYAAELRRMEVANGGKFR